MMRFWIALHATVPAALVAAVVLHLWPPAGWPALAQRPAWATWALIGGWLLGSLACAALLRGTVLWRTALGAAGVLLALAAASGLALSAPIGWAMGSALIVLGLACAALAASIGPARVQPARRGRHPHAAAPSPRHQRAARPWNVWLAAQAAHAPFWLTGALAVESFRLAHIVAAGAARPSGMVGLLLACLVALPAATLRSWLPRTSAALWCLAALGYAGLAFKAGLPQWAVAAACCTLAALVAALHRRAGRWRLRRLP